MNVDRRELLALGTAGLLGSGLSATAVAQQSPRGASALTITGMKVTPIALPDPPLLAASGCHGPYFLRNVIQLETDSGIVGIGETRGGDGTTKALEQARSAIIGKSAFAYRAFARELQRESGSVYAGIELACLDACGRATGRRLCELLGGPIHDQVEFAAYLFYRYAADNPKLLADPRLVDNRGRGAAALDEWGEVRTAESMVELAARFRDKFGFRVFKLKAGVLPPDVELETIRGMQARFEGKCPLRIDPNGRWTVDTALRIGKQLHDVALEYYEDPVVGQRAMAEVREKTGLTMSTNMCVTRFSHIPEALQLKPIDVVLCDHHGWGGIPACQALGQIADVAGWRLSQHSNNHAGVTMAAMIHVAAVTPQLTLASDTHYPWLVDGADIIQGGNLPIREGRMKVPERPGVGVELDLDKLARAHETYRRCGMRDRDDAHTMRLVEPGWQRELF